MIKFLCSILLVFQFSPKAFAEEVCCRPESALPLMMDSKDCTKYSGKVLNISVCNEGQKTVCCKLKADDPAPDFISKRACDGYAGYVVDDETCRKVPKVCCLRSDEKEPFITHKENCEGNEKRELEWHVCHPPNKLEKKTVRLRK